MLCFLVGPLTFVQCIMSPGEKHNAPAPHQSKVATRNFNDRSEQHTNAPCYQVLVADHELDATMVHAGTLKMMH